MGHNRQKHDAILQMLSDEDPLIDGLCELNMVERAKSVSYSTVVQQAWELGRELPVHGWIYALEDELLQKMDCCVT